VKSRYDLSGAPFRRKADIAAYVRVVFSRYEDGSALVDDDAKIIAALLAWHPRAKQKIGAGIRDIVVRQNPEWGGKCKTFWVRRIDGTETDFSYRQCLSPSSPWSDFCAACRNAVVGQVLDFRDRYFAVQAGPDGKCACQLTRERVGKNESHVDHSPPFNLLVKDFVARECIDIHAVELTGHEDGAFTIEFKDDCLRERWCAYHRAHAGFLLLCPSANMKKGDRVA
jgi:hypothetical protein